MHESKLQKPPRQEVGGQPAPTDKMVAYAAMAIVGVDVFAEPLPEAKRNSFLHFAHAVHSCIEIARYYQQLERSLGAIPAFLRNVGGLLENRHITSSRSIGCVSDSVQAVIDVAKTAVLAPPAAEIWSYGERPPLTFLLHPEPLLKVLSEIMSDERLDRVDPSKGRSLRASLSSGSLDLRTSASLLVEGHDRADTLSDTDRTAFFRRASAFTHEALLLMTVHMGRSTYATLVLSEHPLKYLKKGVLALTAEDARFHRPDIIRNTAALLGLDSFDDRLKRSLSRFQQFSSTKGSTTDFEQQGVALAGEVSDRHRALMKAIQALNANPERDTGQTCFRVLSTSAYLIAALNKLNPRNELSEPINIPTLTSLRLRYALFAAAAPSVTTALQMCADIITYAGFNYLYQATHQADQATGTNTPAETQAPKGTEASAASDSAQSSQGKDEASISEHLLAALHGTPSGATAEQPKRAATHRSADHRLERRLSEMREMERARAREQEAQTSLELIKEYLVRDLHLTHDQVKGLPLDRSPHTRSPEAWEAFTSNLSSALFPSEELRKKPPYTLGEVLHSAPWLLTMDPRDFDRYILKLHAVSAALDNAQQEVRPEYRPFSPSHLYPEYSIVKSPELFRRTRDLSSLHDRITRETKDIQLLTRAEPSLHPVVVAYVLDALAEVGTDGTVCSFSGRGGEALPLQFCDFTKSFILRSLHKRDQSDASADTMQTNQHRSYVDSLDGEILKVYGALGKNLRIVDGKRGQSDLLKLSLDTDLPANASPETQLLRSMLLSRIKNHQEQTSEPNPKRPFTRRQRLDRSNIPLNSVGTSFPSSKSAHTQD